MDRQTDHHPWTKGRSDVVQLCITLSCVIVQGYYARNISRVYDNWWVNPFYVHCVQNFSMILAGQKPSTKSTGPGWSLDWNNSKFTLQIKRDNIQQRLNSKGTSLLDGLLSRNNGVKTTFANNYDPVKVPGWIREHSTRAEQFHCLRFVCQVSPWMNGWKE